MKKFVILLVVLLCSGCSVFQSNFENKRIQLEEKITILELKVRKARLQNGLVNQEERLYGNESK
jgi:hypothetical protein